MHATPVMDRIIRHVSLRLPNIHAANLAILGVHFYLKNRRLPRSLSTGRAGLNDYIFWKSLGRWSDFEKECVDKETSKQVARRLCPGIGIAGVVDVIHLNGMSYPIFHDAMRRFRGMNAVAKPTHGSGAILFLNEEIPEKDFKKFYQDSMANYFPVFREGQYHKLEKKVVIEENLGKSVDDYKFFCSGGRAFLCQINKERFGDHRLVNLSVPDFEDVGVEYGTIRPDNPLKKPPHWKQFIDFAEKLSAPFEFVRVDLYDGPDGIYFGEFTFTPGAGLTQFSEPQFDVRLLQYVRRDPTPRDFTAWASPTA